LMACNKLKSAMLRAEFMRVIGIRASLPLSPAECNSQTMVELLALRGVGPRRAGRF
jgi:hypothetical protein